PAPPSALSRKPESQESGLPRCVPESPAPNSWLHRLCIESIGEIATCILHGLRLLSGHDFAGAQSPGTKVVYDGRDGGGGVGPTVMQQDDPAVIDCSRCLYQLFSGVGRLGIIGVDSPHHFEQAGVLDCFT